ncbi:hypothetical protein A2892_04270 [Candidatus Woesebacteria bacterium RIFCSPLOWO2_01_FULL_39_10b]|uniref:Peptidase S9 prolyl oligopeptidase catalytic domain-containing protein n=1 Tax=Candidatus Woesebacteria bacterium RIFCSPLOWO2_01_FULL_39_10b TaxID=1802517 RepID=A0A1F8B8H4_9BACT|nr:MAG: hypothetical protein A2892_04270 [Candidatus Woesebacteria bacterium RIFCSPLOWO2_01_FULL_39_10b]
MEKVYFNNSKGDRLCGVISNPASDKSRPIVIMAHGFSTSKNSDTYVSLSKNLDSHKISSFRFDFYGHGESEGKFEDVTVSEAVDDILQAIKYLKKQGYKKIGLMGGSFGGIASIMAASKSEKLYLLVLKSPVSNYLEKEMETKSEKELEDWKNLGYRNYESGDGRKLKLNYTFYEDFKNNDGFKAAPRIKTPTLIVHGDKDETVPYSQSVKTSKLIPNCKLYTVKGANHHYDGEGLKEAALRVMTKFIVDNS